MSYLLLRPAPFDSESMASWLHRLKSDNGLTRWNGLLVNPEKETPHVSDPDLNLKPVHYAALEARTGISADRLQMNSLRNWEQYLVSEFATSGAQRWLLRSAGTKRGLRIPYTICLECLKDDAVQFYRSYWRMALYNRCHKHQKLMSDRCPHCGDPIHLSPDRVTTLDTCPACGNRMADVVPARRMRKESADNNVDSNWHTGIATQQRIALPGSVAYQWQQLDGLYVVLSLLNRSRFAKRLRFASFPPEARQALQKVSASPYTAFEARSIEVRRSLLNGALWLLSEWPNRLVRVFSDAKILSADIYLSQIPVPYWLDRVVHLYLYRPKYRLSSEEIQSARSLLERAGHSVKKRAVERLLGIHDSKLLEGSYPTSPLSMENAIALLMALDTRIASTPANRDIRASLLRDAVAIIFLIAFPLHVQDVCKMALQEATKRWQHFLHSEKKNQTADKLYGTVARLGRKWFELYTQSVRCRFLKYQSPQREFLVTRFGKPYGGHGLQDLFVTLLKEIQYPHPQRGLKALNDLRTLSPSERSGTSF